MEAAETSVKNANTDEEAAEKSCERTETAGKTGERKAPAGERKKRASRIYAVDRFVKGAKKKDRKRNIL